MSGRRSRPDAAEPNGAAERSRRILWFVAFYASSLAAFTALVYTLRYVVRG